MRLVIALGGNALLRRGEPMTAENQRQHVKVAAKALAPIAREHDLVISHGNGPQVGLLALQGAAYRSDEAYPLDILDAETEGMIGYLIEQELATALGGDRRIATLLTQIEVDSDDPAFRHPNKPIGPVYEEAEARELARKRGWSIASEGQRFRRVVASPHPKRIFELGVIQLLMSEGIVVICAGGGGIPTVFRADGSLIGVEAVIDKDRASALLARELKADAFLMLTDVEAVYDRWQDPQARALRRISAKAVSRLRFAAGSMGPKVEAAVNFVEQTGGFAGIGRLDDAFDILRGEAGTLIIADSTDIVWWE